MKLICEKNELLRCVNIVTKAVAAKSPMFILEGILMKAADERLTLFGSDGTLYIKCSAQATVMEDGEVVLPARLLAEILSKFEDCEVTLGTEGNSAVLECGHSKTTLYYMDASGYPEFPSFERGNAVSVMSGQLISMIDQTAFATSQSEDKPILTGILFETDGGTAKMVALDGYRLAIRQEALQSAAQAGEVVIPSKSLREAARILPEEEQAVNIYIRDNLVSLVCGETEIATRLLQGDYVKYKNILPAEHTTRIIVGRYELLGSIERASILARQSKSNLVNFKIESDTLTITSDSEIGKAREEVGVVLTGKSLEIAFNSRFLLDVLKVVEDDEVVLDFNTSISPCMIHPVQGNGFLYLVLPVKTSNG